MKTRLYTMAMLLAIATVPQMASAKGCLKGAAVGGVGGHVAGGHGVVGAAAGCAVGRHVANKKEKQQVSQNQVAPKSVPAK
ncbi:MAG: hypothetical protein JWP47_265 [Polaromonas sp.]|nr:hypothetical protein [Polaromonas sp.]